MAEGMPDLTTDGRAPIQEFAEEECLYMRYHDELTPNQFRFPDQSVNRSRFSLPGQVVSKYPLANVAMMKVKDIPPKRKHPDHPRVKIEYEFKPWHEPEADNYAHSEVRCFKDGAFHRDKSSPPDLLKKSLRTEIFLKMKKIPKENYATPCEKL